MKSEILCVRLELGAKDTDRFIVRLSGDGIEPVEEEFAFDVPLGSQIEQKIEAIEGNACDYDDLNFAGEQLWLGLMSGQVKSAFEKAFRERQENVRVHLRLAMPAQPFSAKYPIDMRALPWESLYNPDIGSLAGDPDFCIIREAPPGAHVGPLRPVGQRALRMLVIIPSGSGLNTDHEVTNIRREGEKLRVPLQLEELVGVVEPDRFEKALARQDWDIVHYVGHGDVDEGGRVKVELNDAGGGEHWMDAEIFARSFARRNIRLAVLNCCYGDNPIPSRSLSGLGPFLMRKGIPAVVAMRYEIADTVAIRFSHSFYQAFFNGSTPGRVDTALDAARAALLLNQRPGQERGFITPVLYLAEGFEQLFPIESPPRVIIKDGEEIQPLHDIELPDVLQQAFRDGRCVPVLGPEVLSTGAVRRATGILSQGAGPRAFARAVANNTRCPYPPAALAADMQLCEFGGEWLSGMLMQWVCQHNQFHQTRSSLLKAIRETYTGLEPGEAVKKIARWQVPGMFYTFFDGLLEGCVNRGESSLNTILPSVRDTAAALDSAMTAKPRPLVLIRGSLGDDDSLVLTEEDYEELLENISRMPPTTTALALQADASVLFLGVSPRDPLIRALARQLLDTNIRKRKQGPSFFVWQQPSAVDNAYWSRYAVEWIRDRSVHDVISALSALVQ